MKIVFSRKGFDASAGGKPSPILPDGTIVSLPIPDEDSPIKYGDIASPSSAFPDLGSIVGQLTGGRLDGGAGAHLDPDIDARALRRDAGWRPLFGQCNQSQTLLENCGVGVGDLFLFFGWYRETGFSRGQLRYLSGAPDIHLLFGWMFVGDVIRLGTIPHAEPSWAAYHPHFHGVRNSNNTLYVAADRFLSGNIVGGGVFRTYTSDCKLTATGASRSLWQLPTWFDPSRCAEPLSYHADRKRWTTESDRMLLRSAGRGQEFVFDSAVYPEAVNWARSLIDGAAIDSAEVVGAAR